VRTLALVALHLLSVDRVSAAFTRSNFILMSAPDYFEWGSGRRYRTEYPIARLRYAGTNGVGEAQFAHGFLRRLHFFLR